MSIAFLALSLTVLLTASGLEIYFNFQNQKKVVAEQQQLIAQKAADTVKNFIQEKFSLLETAVRLGNLTNIRPEEQQTTLEKLLGINPAFRQIILLNAQKQESAKISRLSTLMPFRLTKEVENAIFSKAGQEKKYISRVYLDEITGEPLVIMAVPVKNVLGDFKGILMAEVNLKFMWDVVNEIKVGTKGLAYVIDKQGRLIAFGNVSRVLKEENLTGLKEVNDFIIGEPLTENKIEIAKGINNTYVVTDHLPLGTPDWAVVIELPVREAYASVIRVLGISAWVIFLGIALTVVAGIYLSRKITKPIIKLRDATRKISTGELDTKINVKLKNEIGELAASFNQMVENLSKTTVSRDHLAQEVTERKRTEEALKESETRYKTIYESSADAIMLASPEKGFSSGNPAAIKLFECRDEKEFISLSPAAVSPEYQPDGQLSSVKAQEMMTKAVKEGSHLFEWTHRTKKGREFFATVLLNRMELQNKKFLQATVRDITEHKREEERLKRYATELARANEEVKEFAYIVSHDLRAPLVNIKGFAAELRSVLKTIDSNLNEILFNLDQEKKQKITTAFQQDIPEALDFIDSSATSMDGFINSLLKLSRMGRREMNFEPINPVEIVETTLKGLAHQLEQHRAKITVGQLPEVIGDRTAIEQIIGNILSNAVKYLDPVRTGEIEITGERNEEETTLVIRDNGRGIAKEDIARVFMPFRRFGKQDTQGEGMGLAFAHTLAHRHNGDIRCESELDAGTTFTIILSNHPEQGG